MIQNFVRIHNFKYNYYDSNIQRFSNGLKKLEEAEETTKVLRKKASEMRVELDQKQKEADSALENISKKMLEVSDQKAQMIEVSKQVESKQGEIQVRQNEIQEQLKDVQPAIDEALSAVSCIRPKDLQEITVLRAPPDTIRDILEAVLSMMGIFDTSWQSMKNVLRERGFREKILNFDARNISVESKANVKAKLKHCKLSFTPEQAKRASKAAAPLAAWVTAQLAYSEVLQEVEPLERENNRLKNDLKQYEIKRLNLQEELSVHDQEIDRLKKEYEHKTGIANKLELDVKNNEATIKKAEILVSRLSGEKGRWKVEENNYKNKITNLTEDSCLAAIFSTYLSNLTEQDRILMMQNLNFAGNFSILNLLATETDKLNWKKLGLNSDNQSLENFCMYNILNQNFWSIMYDTSGNLDKFLTNYYKHQDQTVVVISKYANNFYNQLELALRFGKIFIVTNIGKEIPQVLYSVIRNDILGEDDSRKSIILGDKYRLGQSEWMGRRN